MLSAPIFLQKGEKAMLPEINIFGINISTYSLMAMLGLVFAALLVWRLARGREDINSVQIVNIPAIAAIGAFAGAHIMYGITHLDKLWWCINNLPKVFASWDSFVLYATDIFGGMVFYGGLIGGIIAGVIYCRCLKLDTLAYADVLAPAIPLFHAFGRVGCFLGGCCYGIECDWGFKYEHSIAAEANGVTRLPIQLFESAGNLIIAAVLIILFRRKKLKKGMIFLLYLIMYGVLRITTEFFRGDAIRGFLFGISTSQWISIFMILASVIVMHRLLSGKKRESAQ